ncbi:hypothetical protein GCM10009661_11240 [Catellatospora chokoriensis]|uniref:Uncharacterized protein n=1 Tax=Catellatospora chokoriensis TaxID=310353 RepID=A0A8J3NUT7_9ACTN|nr:hypothetical protein Cch02nite_66670 [Catellatospora chokoriensis]
MLDDTPCPQGHDSSIGHKVNEVIHRADAGAERAVGPPAKRAGPATATASRAGLRAGPQGID